MWSLPIFIALLKFFNIFQYFGVKAFSAWDMIHCYLEKRFNVAIWEFKDLTGYFTVFMNYIKALRFATNFKKFVSNFKCQAT